MFKSKGRTSKFPTIQLEKSSRGAATRRSKLTSFLTFKIIDNKLELALLQADSVVEEMERQAAIYRDRDKTKIFKKQEQIRAKLRKQQSLASNYSEQSFKRSSRHCKPANH